MAYKKRKDELLPKDGVIEILLKLPIKSILRFKCISKSWYALLVSSYFTNTHMKLNEKTKLLFINTLEDKFLSFNLKDESFVSVLNDSLEFRSLVGCCNGIICFRSNDDNIVLLNPSTREFKVLPHFTRLLDVNVRGIGFGFDNLNNDYKIILILSVFHKEIRRGHPYTYEIAIYSFRSNTWRKLENENRSTTLENENRSTTSGYAVAVSISLFFNGRVHWNAYDSYWDPYYDDDRIINYRLPMILSMDISTELFYEFEYPDRVLVWQDDFQTNLQIIQGSLSVIAFHTLLIDSQYIDIWLMKEYGVIESWTKQYTIGPYFSTTRALSIWEKDDEVHLMRVFSITENGDEVHLLIQIGTTNICELVRWNLLKNEEVQKYCLENFHINMEASYYSQSLVSIAKNNLDYI